MKLHPLDRKLLMPETHNRARSILFYSPGTDLELGRQTLLLDHQRVVPRGRHRRRKAPKNGLAIMLHLAGLPMHQVTSADDRSAKSRSNRLMPKARPQLPQVLHQVVGKRIVVVEDENHAPSPAYGSNHNQPGLKPTLY